jgi:phosphatidate cytidylyltransferase
LSYKICKGGIQLKRLISGFILIPIVVYIVLYIPILWFLAFTSLVTFYGLWEYNAIALKLGGGVMRGTNYALSCAVIGAFLPLCFYFYGSLMLLPFFALNIVIFAILSAVSRRGGSGLGRDISLRVLGLLYIGLLCTHFLFLREVPDGGWWLLFALVIVWASDTSAYYGGRKFGAHKLAPVISPNKTIEGAVCGLLGAMVSGDIYVLVYSHDVS